MIAGQAFVFAAFFGLWELAVRLLHARPVILPAPSVIFAKIWEQREMLLANTWPTFVAIALGFAAAVLTGFILAVGISYSRAVRELTYPFLVTAQVLPKVAFAPLFLIWFGFGITPKVVIAALIAFFPIVINTAKGLGSVEVELLQYMDSLGATWSEKFLKISLPWALPYIFAAFKNLDHAGDRGGCGWRVRRRGRGSGLCDQCGQYRAGHRADVCRYPCSQRPRDSHVSRRRGG